MLPAEPREPRKHHYIYAHVALRTFVDLKPSETVHLLDGPRGMEFLCDLWDNVGKDLEPFERLDRDGLDCSVRTLDIWPVALVTLPPPVGMTEAHFVAIVLDPKTELCRYFTLEHTITLEGEVATCLCEWTGGEHANYGGGSAVEPNAFLASLMPYLLQ